MWCRYRRPILVALTLCAPYLSACSDVSRVEVQSSPTPSTKAIAAGMSVKVDLSRALSRAYEKANVKTVEQAAVLLAVAHGVETANNQVRVAQGAVHPPSAAVSTSLASVMQCIKDHESGNYTESSHPGSGSGAYQYVPGTWRTWSVRAGFPGYDYAFQAPPDVQDAVTVFTLTHGGAGNWSPRYGPDPCTVGIGG